MSAQAAKLRKIMVVDDDPQISHLLEEVLKLTYDVKVCENGREALEHIDSWNPDLIVMDQNMPELSGLETLKTLRQKENYTSVIFVSSMGQSEKIVEALEASADDYIVKPFDAKELLARIKVRLRINELQEKLQYANQELQKMVEHDYLTGLYNMRSTYDRITQELSRAKRFQRQTAVIMMDLDHFKAVNDTNDHLFGSFVLKEVGTILKSLLREIDFAARYGGDEFLIFLTETNKEGIEVVSERIRETIEKHSFESAGHKIKLTTSIGYALSTNDDAINAKELVKRADRALYRSKESGRNKVTGWSADG